MIDRTKNFWESNYKQNIASMIGICYRYTHNRQLAEDLAHEAFLLAIDKSASFKNQGPFSAWLRRIVVNVALQHLRDQKKQRHLENGIAHQVELMESQDEKQNVEERNFTEAELLETIKLLPEHHRLVFNLYVIDHFTHAQIATELGISEGTSKSHLARARRKIKELLQERLKAKNNRTWALLLLALPRQVWGVDHFFTRGLQAIEIPPQELFPIDWAGFAELATPGYRPAFLLPKIYLKMGVAATGLGFVSILQFNAPPKDEGVFTAPASMTHLVAYPKEENSNKFLNTDTTTATFAKNSIIPVENKETMEKMKNLKTLGAALMLSSVLGVDTSSLMENYELPLVFKKQPIVELAKPDLTKPAESPQLEPKTKRNGPPLNGTFYASSITLESPNNALVLKGNDVKVNLNTQNFKGQGTFSFVNHVDYLVVDGVRIKLNETVNLSNKKYSLNQLVDKEASKKYGEQVKSAIEIALAE